MQQVTEFVGVAGRDVINEHSTHGSRPELGLCRHCRKLSWLQRTRFSNGHEASFIVHDGCDVSYPAILTFGETWVSCTIEPPGARPVTLVKVAP